MNEITALAQGTEQSRDQFLASVTHLTVAQTTFQPNPDTWSILAITEHIVRAEQVGVMGMWKALDGIRNGEFGAAR
jgi:hypothetical protein